MASLTNSGSSVVERNLDANVVQHTDDLEVYYEYSRCVEWIKAGSFTKVCLQFPDELLPDAPTVARALTSRLDKKVYILGDTTYGSCCVDEVAAEHVGADAVIHFGRTCLSPSKRLPVLYVYTRIPVNVSEVISSICRTIEDSSTKLIFVFDTRCNYMAETMNRELLPKYPHLISSVLQDLEGVICSKCCCGKIDTCNIQKRSESDKESSDDTCRGCNCNIGSALTFNGRNVVLPSCSTVKDYQFIFLGPDGPTLTSMLMRFSENTFHCIDPVDASVKSSSGIRAVMSRSGKMEIAKDAEIIGILVGTLGVADYRDVIKRLKHLIKRAGKRSYTFVVGKPNEPKLCNIPEIDVFVYVSCPETAIVERHTDPMLYKKLITPWELELALLEGQEWNLEFEPDFRQLLPGGRRHVTMTDSKLEEQVNVSLLTNKTQKLGVSEVEEEALDSTTGAVILQNGLAIAQLHVGGAGELLKDRSWQGLDASVPAPLSLSQVAEGRSGIASIYKDESHVHHS